MSCRTGVLGQVYVVRWEQPEEDDIKRVLAEVREAYLKTGKQLVFIALTGEDTKPPGDKARAVMRTTLPALRECCVAMHLVVGGKGFRSTVLRSAAAGMFLVSGQRGKMIVHDSLEGAVRELDARMLPGGVEALRRRLELVGIAA